MDRRDELIECLEGEIAKRDAELAACRVAVENCELFRARIGELEGLFSEVTPEMSAAGHAYYQQAIADHGDFTPTGMFKAMVSAICVGKEQA